jgi:membrane fusion protein
MGHPGELAPILPLLVKFPGKGGGAGLCCRPQSCLQGRIMGEGLYRSEVLEQRSRRLWGELILSQPLSVRVLVLALCLLVALALGFLASNSYTRKVSVQGHLVPDRGVIEVPAPQRGLLVELLVKPGDRVEAGQPLFRLQLDHTLGAADALTSSLQGSLEQQRSQLMAQLALQQTALQRSQTDAAGQTALLQTTLEHLQAMLQREQQLEQIRTQALQRTALLQQKGQLARVDLDAAQVQSLQQQQARQDLEVQILQQQTRLQELDTRQHESLTQGQQRLQALQGELAEVHQRLARVAAEQETIQRAPLAARVSAVHLQTGMQVAPDQSVLALLPAASRLRAELLVPSAAIGFVGADQQVKLRFDAFPYQKFGMQQARLESVMQSPEPPRPGDNSPPHYRVLARLEQQSVLAYGVAQPLMAGMQFTADVVVDERSLLEWLLEPLFSIRGRS